MEDFPVCPSSERTMSVLPPFRLWLVKIGRFYRKVVSANLFPDTLPKSKDCTAQSLSRFATAPFTQGSPWRVPRQVANHCPNNPTNSQFVALLRKADNHKTLIELIQLLGHVVEGNGELPPFLAGKVGAHVGETPPAVAVELGVRRFQFLP